MQLAEPRLAAEPGWLEDVLRCADDDDARVRFQAAITLGAVGVAADRRRKAAGRHREDAIAAALARVAVRDGSDRWLRAAVFSSLTGRELGFLAALRELARGEELHQPELVNELGRLLGGEPAAGDVAGADPASRGGPTRLRTCGTRRGLLTGLAEAARSRLTARDSERCPVRARGPAAERDDMAGSIRRLIVENEADRPGRRDRSIDRRRDRRRPAGVRRLRPGWRGAAPEARRPTASRTRLQAAAVRALGTHRDARVVTSLLAAGRFATYPPALREQVLSALITQSAPRARPL